ncbi:MAG TPA: ABC transporter permease subunit [Burkholderiales bacterium]|nr:ABC transporter permease subunit [Burkholderiales bacterium]
MILTLAAKELKSLFAAPLAWLVLCIVQLLLAWIFLSRLDTFLLLQPQLEQLAQPPGATEVILAPLFGSVAVLIMMAVPLLSMRLIAEERRNQTMPLLMSAPLSMTEIVIGKFLGLVLFLAALISLSGFMAISLYAGTSPDFGVLASNLLGLLLLSACYAALGLYISCLTSHPVLAAVGTLGALLGLWVLDVSSSNPESLSNWFSLLRHFESFNRGLIDSADVAFLVLFTLTFVALAIRRLDADRLRG